MTEQNSQIRLPAIFDNQPELKAKMIEYLKTLSPEEKQKRLDDYNKFINGEITWAEIRKISKRMQKEVARVAYLKFKMNEYDKAESIFKGLAIVDHTNWYYRAALGAVYQKQLRFDDAIDEYTVALTLKEDEVSCLVNRGECLLLNREYDAANADFAAVIQMKLPDNSPWSLRAKMLSQRTALAKQEDVHDK